MSDLSPTDLLALLDREGVPMEARAPVTLNKWGDFWEHRGPHRIDDDLAELAHVGAMVKWLGSRGIVLRREYQTAWNCRSLDGITNYGYFESEVHALAHACGRIAEGATP